MADDLPYLARGAQPMTTESSTLISSSAYLNEPRLRDWLAGASAQGFTHRVRCTSFMAS